MAENIRNILLCGVGGQGTVLASKLIAKCAISRGLDAHTAETIGMAQRGGCVVSHVRIGEAHSPLIAKGTADTIIAFEPAEAVRNLHYLKKGGTVVVSSAAVKPVTDSLSYDHYDGEKMIEYLEKCGARLIVVDGKRIIDECGTAKVLNIALLSAAAKAEVIGITVDELEDVIKTGMKPQFYELNMKAAKLGQEFVG